MNVAIIPARGGSKRIPRKNIKDFSGKPIIAYSIQCALQARVIDKVIVSTDDQEIADISREYGAEVPFLRPEGISGDHSDLYSVIIHAVTWLKERGENISNVCCLFATAPFVSAVAVEEGYGKLVNEGWQYVFSAARSLSSVYRSFEMNDDGGVSMIFPEYYDTRTQDLPGSYFDAGQFYWAKSEVWLKKSRIFDGKSTFIEIPKHQVHDIDTEEDWLLAEFAWDFLRQVNNS